VSDVLLDSNLIIYSLDPTDVCVRPFIRLHSIFASDISVVETLGFHKLREVDRAGLELFFKSCVLLPVDREVIRIATALRQSRKRTLGDALIAATAVAHALTLATRNAVDFADIEHLNVIDPFAV
jgi:toxin FitB